jgi:hypothetical protein
LFIDDWRFVIAFYVRPSRSEEATPIAIVNQSTITNPKSQTIQQSKIKDRKCTIMAEEQWTHCGLL